MQLLIHRKSHAAYEIFKTVNERRYALYIGVFCVHKDGLFMMGQ